MDSAISSIPIEHLAASPKLFKQKFGGYVAKHELKSRLRIINAVGHPTTVPQLEAWILEQRDRGFPVDALVVDYDAYLRTPHGKDQKKHETVEVLYRDLVTLAGKHNLILWTGAQSNRGTEKLKILGEDHIAEGVVKLNFAHMVISIGQGDWGPDSFYLWVGYHKFDRKHVGCNITPNLDRMIFYDHLETLRAERQYGTGTMEEEEDL
jgi:hypothetical protein